jgi:hypothetical protein
MNAIPPRPDQREREDRSVPKKPKSDTILECYRRAEEARRMADAATSQFERADFLDVAQRWLSLARSPQLWSDPGCEDNDEAAEGCRRRSGRVLGSG